MVHATDRLAAALVAVSVTLSIVWGMANLGYPAPTEDLASAQFGACLPQQQLI